MPEASNYLRWDELRGTLLSYGADYNDLNALKPETKQAMVAFVNGVKRREPEEEKDESWRNI